MRYMLAMILGFLIFTPAIGAMLLWNPVVGASSYVVACTAADGVAFNKEVNTPQLNIDLIQMPTNELTASCIIHAHTEDGKASSDPINVPLSQRLTRPTPRALATPAKPGGVRVQ